MHDLSKKLKETLKNQDICELSLDTYKKIFSLINNTKINFIDLLCIEIENTKFELKVEEDIFITRVNSIIEEITKKK
jgi:hypothetical protein